jgi:hypothetical protein
MSIAYLLVFITDSNQVLIDEKVCACVSRDFNQFFPLWKNKGSTIYCGSPFGRQTFDN